jgi:hypothetical protein
VVAAPGSRAGLWVRRMLRRLRWLELGYSPALMRIERYCRLRTLLVSGPRKPVAGSLCARWNFLSAWRVLEPNVEVSLPGEPGPVIAMVKLWVLRNFWSARMLSPSSRSLRSFVNRNAVEDVDTGAGAGWTLAGVIRNAESVFAPKVLH